MLAGASAFVCAVLGFLFGIPRAAQENLEANEADRARYRGNTNLEQISDWLTKILVGVGLTQLTELPSFLSRLGDYFNPLLGSGPFAVAIILYFAANGFLFGYLWTRLLLVGELTRAEYAEVLQALREGTKGEAPVLKEPNLP
jgi:hypothetical protein